jgi:hypothetical protein
MELSKKSMLSATPSCMTAIGRYRSWFRLENWATRPIPEEATWQRISQIALEGMEKPLSHLYHEAAHECSRIAAAERIADREFVRYGAEAVRPLDEILQQSDTDLIDQFMILISEMSAKSHPETISQHPIVKSVYNYWDPSIPLLAWLSTEIRTLVVDSVFESFMNACARAAELDKFDAPVRVRSFNQILGHVRLRELAISSNGWSITTESNYSAWAGVSLILDDAENEYMVIGSHDESSGSGSREKHRITQFNHPIIPSNIQQIRLIIDPENSEDAVFRISL